MNSSQPTIVVLGNIAAGKTTLSSALAERFSVEALNESPGSNPFLPGMHSDPARWCLANQVWFMREASKSLRNASLRGGILDHSQQEVFPIHSRVFRERGWLTSQEFDLLADLSALLLEGVPDPDFYVVLHAPGPTIIERVKNRQRSVDGVPEVAHLDEVSTQRDAFLARTAVPHLRFSSVEHDFRQAEHCDSVAEMIREALGTS
jgi:deoxyadenosine/deoxycytidine kinase